MNPVFVGCFLTLLFAACRDIQPLPQPPTEPDTKNAVWVAAPQHNNLMHHPDTLTRQLDKLKTLGINTLFVCAWADNLTAWKSRVLLQNSNYPSLEATWMYRQHASGDYDPLADLIEKAHARQMKVILWFEYGLMAAWGKEPNADNHPVLAAHPDWKGIGNDGKGSNYNNTDFYYNSYHPEVQQFILDLIQEALDLYPDIDGIQGDDRLPASPANSGYDETTRKLFREAHMGQEPPADFRDSSWVQWRLGILNQLAGRMHQLVKSQNPNLVMAFSPNPYPWCLENLMQDWPSWIQSGHVDQLNVQVYRTSFTAYRNTADASWDWAAKSGLKKEQFVPGIILGLSSKKMMNPSLLDSILHFNREQQYGGESYFYVKWLTEDSSFDDLIKGN